MDCRTCHHAHDADPAQDDGRNYSDPNYCVSRLSSLLDAAYRQIQAIEEMKDAAANLSEQRGKLLEGAELKLSDTRKILAELGLRVSGIEAKDDKAEILVWMQGVMEKRHDETGCQHKTVRENVYWNEAGSVKSRECCDCGSQLSCEAMICKPEYAPRTLDPWCAAHDRSVIRCIKEISSKLETANAEIERLKSYAERLEKAATADVALWKQDASDAKLQLGEATRKGEELCGAYGSLLMELSKAWFSTDTLGAAFEDGSALKEFIRPMMSPSKIRAVTEKRNEAGCPDCELGVHGKDALCDKHYSEYLGTHRARGNGPGD